MFNPSVLKLMKIILRIYNAASGQWAGTFFLDGVEIGGVAGCSSPKEVEEAAYEQGFEIESIELYKSFI